MSAKNVKDVRKQIRNVIQENLGDLVTNELVQAVEAKLIETFTAKLNVINDNILAQLREMDNRSKDVQQFIMNQVSAQSANVGKNIDLNKQTESTTLTAE